MAYTCSSNESRRIQTLVRIWSRDPGEEQIKPYEKHKLTISRKMLWAQLAKDERQICRNPLANHYDTDTENQDDTTLYPPSGIYPMNITST